MLKYDWWEFILFVMISVWFDLLRWINVLKVETCGLLASYIWDWGFVQVLYLVVKDINCEVVLVIALSFFDCINTSPLGSLLYRVDKGYLFWNIDLGFPNLPIFFLSWCHMGPIGMILLRPWLSKIHDLPHVHTPYTNLVFMDPIWDGWMGGRKKRDFN